MQLTFERVPISDRVADVSVLFIYRDASLLARAKRSLRSAFGPAASGPIDAGDFQGKGGEVAIVYLAGRKKPSKLLLVGIGDERKLSLEQCRRAAAGAAKKARSLKAISVALFLPPLRRHHKECVVAFAEGAALGLYRFDKYLTAKNADRTVVERVVVCSADRTVVAVGPAAVAWAQHIVEGTSLARNLANAPGNEIYPETLAAAAVASGERNGFGVKVLDEGDIKELGMGGIIGVSMGSVRPPRLIIMEYGDPARKPVVLVGKGVTFDTGGISIKPSAGMAEMKMDMSGAAAVIGTFETVSRLKLPVRVVGIIPAVENMPGGSAIRPGDILTHYNGKTSEVDNTDAEGRLILADALGYAETFKPAAVIDLATLTGAVVVALGHVATGMMGNDASLMKRLRAAGEKTHERVWELPLFDEYEKLIRSDVADVKNVGGRWAGSITAGWFLKKFIGSYRWVHLDIAGTAILEEHGDYTQRGASGVGVRLLTEFLRGWK